MKNPLKPVTPDSKPVRKDPSDFVQITRGYLKETRELAKKSLTAFLVFTFLTERMNRNNAIVVSQTTLCELLGVSRSALNTAIKILKNENWVQVVKIGQANGYLVNSKVVWRSHQKKRYGYFNADIIVSETEQTDSVESLMNQPLKEIPNVKHGETMIDDGSVLPPPDQPSLLEPDPDFVPHIKIDPETGEVLE